LIHFDHRGTGLSDPVTTDQLPDLHTPVDDAVAVLHEAGSERAAVIGLNEGSNIASLHAINGVAGAVGCWAVTMLDSRGAQAPLS
jgi:pimeloyl-ACP methyl ester carboxylesterase